MKQNSFDNKESNYEIYPNLRLRGWKYEVLSSNPIAPIGLILQSFPTPSDILLLINKYLKKEKNYHPHNIIIFHYCYQ